MARTKNVNRPEPSHRYAEEREEEEDEEEEESEEEEDAVDPDASEGDGDGMDEDEDMPDDFDTVDLSSLTPEDYARYRNANQYERARDSAERRFWTDFQRRVYEFAYPESRNFVQHQPISWARVNQIEGYEGLYQQMSRAGLADIVTLSQRYNPQAIRQFYATLHVAADRSSITWMTGYHRLSVTKAQIEQILGFPPGDGLARVHDEPPLSLELQSTFYRPQADHPTQIHIGKVDGLFTLPGVVNRLLRKSILPRAGNPDEIRPPVWNILQHIFTGVRFDIVHCILEEMARSAAELQKSIYFAPYIMKIILAEFDYMGALTVSLKGYTPREKQRIYHPEDAQRFFEQQQQQPQQQGELGGQFQQAGDQQPQWPPQGFVPEGQGVPPHFFDTMLQRMDSLTTSFSEFQVEMRTGFQTFGTQFSAFDSRLTQVETLQGQHTDTLSQIQAHQVQHDEMFTGLRTRQIQHGHGLHQLQQASRPPVYRRRSRGGDGGSSSGLPPQS